MQSTKIFPRAARALSYEAHASRLQRAPYICAACQATTRQLQRRPQPPQPTRPFTTSPTRAQQPPSPPTHYELFPQTFPSGPPPRTAFTPDLRLLRQEYLQLQSRAHPDLAPPERKAQFEALSSRINEAYRTLQDPLRRARYLLAQRGIDVEDESAKLSESESELLMEVMEAREAVEAVEEEEELAGLREENEGRIEGSVGVLEGAFAEGDLERAARETIRLRYWMNIRESIAGWEKGRGPGPIHH